MDIPPADLVLFWQRIGNVKVLPEAISMGPNLIHLQDVVLNIDTELQRTINDQLDIRSQSLNPSTYKSPGSLFEAQISLHSFLWTIPFTAIITTAVTGYHQSSNQGQYNKDAELINQHLKALLDVEYSRDQCLAFEENKLIVA